MTRIWDQSNLHAWCVVPFDTSKRNSEERAAMLAELGIRRFAYDWRDEHIPEFSQELSALKAHGIDLLAWWWGWEVGDPNGQAALELFKANGLTPRIWVAQNWEQAAQDAMPTTDEEQAHRVEREARRISDIAQWAAPYGCHVDLYNHNDWFGLVENQLAVRQGAEDLGAVGVGLTYNLSHAKDPLHDDTVDFAAVWRKIQPHVTAVNLSGTHVDHGLTLLPGDGERELEMMRIIEASGWRGPIGIIAEYGGDAREVLRVCRDRVAWLVRELDESGSGGPKPAAPARG